LHVPLLLSAAYSIVYLLVSSCHLLAIILNISELIEGSSFTGTERVVMQHQVYQCLRLELNDLKLYLLIVSK
jgi:hypothetical protein